MNYLSHFVFNHEVRDLPCESYFALGVVLPDLWMRFSRKRRIRWKAVRAAEPTNAVGRNLRAGLLNHIEADRLFHTAPVFLRWQRELKERVGADDIHPALVDFLAHAMLELALDHHLLHEDESLLPRFFDVLAGCDAELAAQRVGVLGAVDTDGLGAVISGFRARRFLHHYRTVHGLADVASLILALAGMPPPPEEWLRNLAHQAVSLSAPGEVWKDLCIDQELRV